MGMQQWLGACLWLPRNHSLEKGSTPFFSLLVNQGVLEIFFPVICGTFLSPIFHVCTLEKSHTCTPCHCPPWDFQWPGS